MHILKLIFIHKSHKNIISNCTINRVLCSQSSYSMCFFFQSAPLFSPHAGKIFQLVISFLFRCIRGDAFVFICYFYGNYMLNVWLAGCLCACLTVLHYVCFFFACNWHWLCSGCCCFALVIDPTVGTISITIMYFLYQLLFSRCFLLYMQMCVRVCTRVSAGS